MTFKELCSSLEAKIIESGEQGTSLEEAEKLAAKFLSAQLRVSDELKSADLNSRMRKSGVKALRAAAYLEVVQGSDKKPTEAQCSALVESNDLVISEQNELDSAEVSRDELERYYNIFSNAHVYYRGIAKGSFGG